MSTPEPTPMPSITTVRIPIVKKGEYDLWSMKMRQYIAITDYALWDIIVNGNQVLEEPVVVEGEPKPPQPQLSATVKRNQDKALNILLSAIPDGHLLKFHNAKDAKQLWAAIKTGFGGNDASKKMHRSLLKQQFETFTVGEREGLDAAYERFQNLLSMLEIHGVDISTKDANLKFLRSLPSIWHVIATMIRGQPDLATMDFDDLYNNLKVYEHEMNGKSGSTSHNITFVSSAKTSSTSTKSTAYPVQSIVGDVYTTMTTTTSPPSNNINCDDVVCSFFAQQATLPITYEEDLLQIEEDDLEEIDIRWQVAMITARIKKFMKKTGRGIDFKAKQGIAFDKSKIECFNCQRTGHFARECKFAKYQANRMIEKPKTQIEIKEVPEPKPKALVAQENLSEVDWSTEFHDEPVTLSMVAMEEFDWSTAFDEESRCLALDSTEDLGGFDWSMESEDEPVLLALVATSPTSPTATEVLNDYVFERDKHNKSRTEVLGYQLTLESMEAKIITHENNELAWAEQYKQHDYQLKLSEWKLGCKVSELEKMTKERGALLDKLASWKEAGLTHASFCEKQRRAHIKTGLGYGVEYSSSEENPTSDKEQENSEELSTSEFETCSEENRSSSEEPISPTPPEFKKDEGYHAVPHAVGSFQPPRKDVSCYGVDNLEFRNKLKGQSNPSLSEEKVEITKDASYKRNARNANNDKRFSKVFPKPAVFSNLSQRTASHSAVLSQNTFQNTANFKNSFNHSPRGHTGLGYKPQRTGFGSMNQKLCFVCYSPNHLIKDCNLHSEYLSQYPKTKSAQHRPTETKPVSHKPVWNYSNRVNHSNFTKTYRYPQQKRSFSKQPVPSGHTFQGTCKPKTVFSQSTVRRFSPNQGTADKRPYRRVPKPQTSTQKVKTMWVKKESTAGDQPVLSECMGGKKHIAEKESCFSNKDQVLKHKKVIDHVHKNSGNYILKDFKYVTPQGEHKSVMAWGNPEEELKDHLIVDSGCSGSMTGEKEILSDFRPYFGGKVAFGDDATGGRITGKGTIKTGKIDFENVRYVKELKFNLLSVSQICDKKYPVLFTDTECLILSPEFKFEDENLVILRAPRHNDVYSIDMKNIISSEKATCLIAKATLEEAHLWHRRLGHVNFKNINKLVKGNLVRGLPSKTFKTDHSCLACKKGKQHKASCKKLGERTVREPLELLHMDLFGPVSVSSLNKKKYCLVVTDDCSRFSWVFFLGFKDETFDAIHDLIISLENQLRLKVRGIRCDNGTEFKNKLMDDFCANKGIKREFSIARTPQQNGVAERKNRTLIEAARTMLADSLLPIQFWAEAVSAACYILNRVSITKPQMKTPYELLMGRKPSISFMKPFGCPLTILNTIDNLGKFDGKSDEGYLLGYSTNSKGFRVYNKVTKKVQDCLHVEFLEDQTNQRGKGPDWMFDLDVLTPSMNYVPVREENQVVHSEEEDSQFIVHGVNASSTADQDTESIPVNKKQSTVETQSTDDSTPIISDEDQAIQDELNRMLFEETLAKSYEDEQRRAYEAEKTKGKSKNSSDSTLDNSTLDPSTLDQSTAAPFESTSGGVTSNTWTNTDDWPGSSMPPFEESDDELQDDGIFSQQGPDFTNLEDDLTVPTTHTSRVHKNHPTNKIIGSPTSEPKNVAQALTKESWVEAMQEELLQFKLQEVWVLCDLPDGMKVIGTRWVFRVKRDERGNVIKNKARLVAQGYRKEEGVDYDEVFAPVARIEAIRLFLAFASYMRFPVYQMDVKSAFLYGKITKEVYVKKPPGFEDPKNPNKVYKVVKALYGLHQAPRAWYERLSNFLVQHGYRRGAIDKTLFIKRDKKDIMLVQVYVDDIIFGATKQSMVKEFEELMQKEFQMSSMGELTFFLGLQVKQSSTVIFISQDKYVTNILKKFNLNTIKPVTTPIKSSNSLGKDEDGKPVEVKLYRSMVGCLMYLTASRPDIIINTVGDQPVLSECMGGKKHIAEKESCFSNKDQVFKHKKVIDHVHKNSGNYILKDFKYVTPQGEHKSVMAWGNPEEELKDHLIVDSGCSGSMTGEKEILSDFRPYFGGKIAFGDDATGGRITGKGTIKTGKIDFENVRYVKELKFNLLSVSQICDKKYPVLFTDTECLILSPEFKFEDENLQRQHLKKQKATCLIAKATLEEAHLWHRRLGHVNFKNINKLVKGNLVRGLPSKTFKTDHSCLACKKGKQHKSSCKKLGERTVREPLELLHMDLFGPVSVSSLNKKKYCLVVTDDCSRFSWVFFLGFKDETFDAIHDLIISLENQLRLKVRGIRCDNGTEFKNKLMDDFCANKGIKREFSIARTPQQNGVAERKNRTLIEAARTMLVDSLLPIQFWAEAVSAACYILNRVSITKPQMKTPYELLMGRKPSKSFMKPFGCPLTILNTIDNLGKFDGKSDEGYLLGYSTNSKGFRVYKKVTKKVQDCLHVEFLEDQTNQRGKGPDWMFDLDGGESSCSFRRRRFTVHSSWC
ncbi:ribonuclease H-like domain-containing protein [Artemisia annua]|uniref:Ribonuclease H-like domain-containing protein n=1 Tax=Artemisia annua TaxID=35608 RepID=A0A2U1P949_ARTAN|nr:ribonuclease H-like domain-containing protein [Artemisia annua]